jgi:phage recombination protein Bet
MSNAVVTLPAHGDASVWSESEKALVEAAGLVSRGRLAPRPVVEAFLVHCRRTGLDPIARQIYCIERGGKWTTQISIDGARLVAERSGQYAGQTPTQWTGDGVTWTDVWLAGGNPAAARVGVHRVGFAEPLYAVATWDAYNAGTPIWKKMPALMLGKCAEMLALRKAFPQDLSGLYSAEEMDQAAPAREERPTVGEPARAAVTAPAATRDWWAEVTASGSVDELRVLWRAAQEAGALAEVNAEGVTLEQFILAAKNALTGEVVDAEVVDEPEPLVEAEAPQRPVKRQWVREARGITERSAMQQLISEAMAGGAPEGVMDELAQMAKSLQPSEPVTDWAVADVPQSGEAAGDE